MNGVWECHGELFDGVPPRHGAGIPDPAGHEIECGPPGFAFECRRSGEDQRKLACLIWPGWRDTGDRRQGERRQG